MCIHILYIHVFMYTYIVEASSNMVDASHAVRSFDSGFERPSWIPKHRPNRFVICRCHGGIQRPFLKGNASIVWYGINWLITFLCLYAYIQVYMYICIYVYMYICIYIHIYRCIYIRIHVHIYIYMYSWSEFHTGRCFSRPKWPESGNASIARQVIQFGPEL